MRQLYFLLSLIIVSSASAQSRKPRTPTKPIIKKVMPRQSPLAAYSMEWNDAKYQSCNTAATANYLTQKEKDIIYILNLIRSYPEKFAKTVYANYRDYIDRPIVTGFDYYQTLMDTLLHMKPVNILKPDNKCFQSALCHAAVSGKDGFVGHNRSTQQCKDKQYFNGECIDYGSGDPLTIVLHLMIDEGIPSLGHRHICIMDFVSIGVSIQPHKQYRNCTVIDFKY